MRLRLKLHLAGADKRWTPLPPTSPHPPMCHYYRQIRHLHPSLHPRNPVWGLLFPLEEKLKSAEANDRSIKNYTQAMQKL